MEPIPGLNFTTIDFEAANSNRASAIAVGVTSVRDGLITGTWATLIRPHTGLDNFDPYAMAIHGISPESVAEAAPLDETVQIILDLIGDEPVLAHNMGYDRDVLFTSAGRTGRAAPANEFRCTMTLSRVALGLTRTKLHLVAEHLGLPAFQIPDAGADALTTARIALAIARTHGATSITGLYKKLGIA
jgi:DNA polymerase-3 subunit epsilon